MLTLQNITASYGPFPVLFDVSIDVAAGEIRVILGANGAGKSTLLKSIMNLVPTVSGTLRGPGGIDLLGMKTHQIAKSGIAYVTEGHGILNSLTVMENLQVGAIAAEDRSDQGFHVRLHYVLDLFPALKAKLNQPAGLLSGGQQQMLAIGRALIPEPKVLLLDEPSLGLAPFIRSEIAELLVRIVQESKPAVILVEQDVKLAENCGSNFQVLRRGRLGEPLDISEIKDRERLSRLYLGADSESDLKQKGA